MRHTPSRSTITRALRLPASVRPGLTLPLAAAIVGITPLPVEAAIIVTYAENSDSYVSTLSGTTVLNFNSLPAGSTVTNLAWTNGSATVGIIDHVHILAANAYGGASATNYAVQSRTLGGAGATPTTTLRFESEHSYFGFWWSAGDASNVLTFYLNDEMVAQFTTSTLLNRLAASPEYYGNPRTNQNTGEAYAFINFFGLEGTGWDTIVFSNLGSSGFESDNWTDRTDPWGSQPGETGPLPGVKVAWVDGSAITTIPEPSTVLCLTSVVSLLLRRKR